MRYNIGIRVKSVGKEVRKRYRATPMSGPVWCRWAEAEGESVESAARACFTRLQRMYPKHEFTYFVERFG